MNEQAIRYMSALDLVSGDTICSIQAEPETLREQLKAVCLARLQELNADKALVDQFVRMSKKLDAADKKAAEFYTRQNAEMNAGIPLKFDGKGNPLTTIENFLIIMRNDPKFESIKYNELSYRYEHIVDGKCVEWKNVDDSIAREYIETTYHLHSEKKLDDAMRIAFSEKAYHPVRELIEAVKWDGVPRMQNLFVKWLKCEDSAYTREVTRLVFAGGIHRVYNPGCKFDDVAVFVGTHQGEGKSSFIRWLAMEDRFFAEIKNIDSKDDKEVWQGKWICELAELMAVTKAKEVENVKSFITTQTDRYRMSYDKRTEDYPRQCVFIGTTNKEQFLTDKTGNRRWYPLKVHSSGYDLFDRKEEIQRDIVQCWAEAKALYDEGKLEPYANREILSEIRAKQAQAVEDDYRTGMIEAYLKNRDKTCILELWQVALDNPYSKPTRRDSNDITLILQGLEGWERGIVERYENYGTQLCWNKRKDFILKDLTDEDFDF